MLLNLKQKTTIYAIFSYDFINKYNLTNYKVCKSKLK